jgi:hypothetical protein
VGDDPIVEKALKGMETGVVYIGKGVEGVWRLFRPTDVITSFWITPGVRPVKTRVSPETVGVRVTSFTL